MSFQNYLDWEQRAKKLLMSLTSFLKQPFHTLTITLLSLLLPLSFLLLARLSCANYLLNLSFTPLHPDPNYNTTTTSSTLFSLLRYATPSLLYFLVSIVSTAAFIHCLTGKITIITEFPTPIFRPRLYTAWIFLCTLQVCVGLGIEGSIAAGINGATLGGVDERICLLSRAIFFLGLHETMLHWCRVVVKPVVDDTVFGAARGEKWVERVAVAASFGCIWWWRLRDEVESLVVVAKAKRELSMGIGVADFVGWWLYYLIVTIGMVRVVKGVMWLSMVLLCRRRSGGGNFANSCAEDHDLQDNKNMANAFFPFTPFDFGVLGGLTPQLEDYEKDQEVAFKVKPGHLFAIEELGLGEVDSALSSEHGFHQEDSKAKKGGLSSHFSKDPKPTYALSDNFNFDIVSSEHGFHQSNKSEKGLAHLFNDQDHRHYQQHHHYQQQQPKSNLDNFNFDFAFPPAQPIQDGTHQLTYNQFGGSDIAETNKHLPHQSSLAVLELLNSYGSAFKKLRGERTSSDTGNEAEASSYVGQQKLSTEEIMRVAGARYVQFSNQGYGDFYPLHPFGYALTGLSEEETKDAELAHILLAAAEKVGYQQFERANRLLLRCEWIASFKGNPIQRIVFYFAEALRERIERETGSIPSKAEEMSISGHGLSTNLTYLAYYQEVPFHSVMQFTGIQAIIESVALGSKVHLIDLEIRSGVQWTGLMESLAEREECPVELLTITAVGVAGKQKIEETGKRLTSVAESLNIPFQFKAVIISAMEDIKDQLFDVEDDEAVAVYAPLILRTMISRPSCLENLMRVMRNLTPCIMVVIEVEANHNSPSFVNRFIDALFYYSAFFDCLETCMKQEEYRMLTEDLLREGIRNIVAAEGSERVARSVKMDVWRAFFARFGMVEMNFSNASLYQASLVAKRFGCPSCTLDRNGKCLIVGWKGTPIHSVSAWKFR